MTSRQKVTLLFICFGFFCTFAVVSSRKIILDVLYKKIQSSQVDIVFYNLTENANVTDNHQQSHFHPSSVNTCPKNMEFVKLYGSNETFCECKARFLYYSKNDSCYEAYRKGPCKSTEYLILEDGKVRCVENPCKVDGHVQYEGNCYPLQSIDGPCGAYKYLNVNETSFQVECINIDVVPFIIVQFPKKDCPSGSRRNILGICKEEIKDS